jgi:RND family efflux transporter MFP subunit
MAGTLVLILSLNLGLAALLAGCTGRADEPQPAAPSSRPAVSHAPVAEVRLMSVPLRVEVTGQVAAAVQATLSSQIRATVQALPVREGTTVSKGRLLVRLDDRDLRANLSRAEAELDNARVQLTRMETLFAEESVAKQELDNARRAFKVAEAGRQAAAAQLSYAVITAPFDAVVTEKKVEVGELASPGQPLLKLENPKRLRLEATVAEGDLKAAARGASIAILIDALGAVPLQGTVAQVLPTGDPATHTFLVKVDLPPTEGVKSGMFGRMQLETGSRDTLVAPRAAIVERGGLTGVFVVGADRVARLRWIKVGRAVGEQMEVLSGLNVHEQVLADGAKGADGAPVQAPGRTAP